MKKIFITIIMSLSSLTFAAARTTDSQCQITGCSGEICMNQPLEKDDGIATTCEYKEYYECFKIPNCVMQKSNQCSWESSPSFKSCLKAKKAPNSVQQKYMARGKSVLSFIISVR